MLTVHVYKLLSTNTVCQWLQNIPYVTLATWIKGNRGNVSELVDLWSATTGYCIAGGYTKIVL